MKLPPASAFLLAAGLLAGTRAGGAEPAPPAAPAAKPADKAAPAKPAPAPDAVQSLEREFGERSNRLIENRKVLIERLRLARTEEEKQRILAELRQQQQERIDQQRELARQIREQMQQRRSEPRAAGPGN